MLNLYSASRGFFTLEDSTKDMNKEFIHTSNYNQVESNLKKLKRRNVNRKISLCTYLNSKNATEENINEVCAIAITMQKEMNETYEDAVEPLETFFHSADKIGNSLIPMPNYVVLGYEVTFVYCFAKPLRLIPKTNKDWLLKVQKEILRRFQFCCPNRKFSANPMNSMIPVDTLERKYNKVWNTIKKSFDFNVFYSRETEIISYDARNEIKELSANLFAYTKTKRPEDKKYYVSLRPRKTQFDFAWYRVQFLQSLCDRNDYAQNPDRMMELFIISLVHIEEDPETAYILCKQFNDKLDNPLDEIDVRKMLVEFIVREEKIHCTNNRFFKELGLTKDEAVNMGFHISDRKSYLAAYKKQRAALDKVMAKYDCHRIRDMYIKRVHAMARKRMTVAKIASILHLSTSTVRRYLELEIPKVEYIKNKLLDALRELRNNAIILFPDSIRSNDFVNYFLYITS